jgi:hypothetical protein
MRRARDERLKGIRRIRITQHLQRQGEIVKQERKKGKGKVKKVKTNVRKTLRHTKVALSDCDVLRMTSKGPSPTHTTRATNPLVQSLCSYLNTIVWLIRAVVCRCGEAPANMSVITADVSRQTHTQREREREKEERLERRK